MPAAGTTTAPMNAQIDPCLSDSYTPEPSVPDWDPLFTDLIENVSQANWDGGRLVRLGSDGGCSLAVLEGESARLTATNVYVTDDDVTGHLDLGRNRTLGLVDAAGWAAPTVAGAPSPTTRRTATAASATAVCPVRT
jgi:hypothetical protein